MLKIISEKLKFKTDHLLKEWRDKVKEEQNRSNIRFDLENDDTIGNIRRLSFDTEEDILKSRTFYVQLCAAGGDWEMPILYFRIQSQYSTERMGIFIPSRENGNGNLVEGKKGWVSKDQTSKKDDERDEAKAWKSVKEYLSKIDPHDI